MKHKIWNSLVLFIVLLTILSFGFLFREQQVDPKMAHIPFTFWTGLIVTMIVVFCTFLASKFFPYEDPKKP